MYGHVSLAIIPETIQYNDYVHSICIALGIINNLKMI